MAVRPLNFLQMSPLPQAMPNNIRHRPVDHSAGPSAHLMHRRVARSRCLQPRKTPSPARRQSFPVLARTISGVCPGFFIGGQDRRTENRGRRPGLEFLRRGNKFPPHQLGAGWPQGTALLYLTARHQILWKKGGILMGNISEDGGP